MLQGLVIRQALLVADVILVAGIVAMAVLIGVSYTRSPDVFLPASPAEASSELSPNLIAQVKDRSEYDRIVLSGLFGSAGQLTQEPSAAPPPEPVVEETQLRLRLCGTAATSPRDVFATAIIQNDEIASVGTYGIGQEITLDVVLEEVYPRKVIIYNKAANRREVLRFEGDPPDDGLTQASLGGGGSPSAGSAAAAPQTNIVVNRAELFRELNFDSLRDMYVTFQYDENGKANGVASSNWESAPMGKRLGLKNGDVIKTINGEPVDENNGLARVVSKYRDAKTVRIGVLRNGQPTTITYTFQ